MRLSHCESHCAAPLRYIPCLPKSKDASGDSASPPPPLPAAVAATDEAPPIVQRIEVAVVAVKNDKDTYDEKHKDGEDTMVATAVAPTKSNLKKADCDETKCAAKGNVKWLDLLGKDLTEIKEFEPSECGDSLYDGDTACICVIQ